MDGPDGAMECLLQVHTVIYFLCLDRVIMAKYYHKTANISCTLVVNKIVDHSDVVGALSVGAVPTTSSFST